MSIFDRDPLVFCIGRKNCLVLISSATYLRYELSIVESSLKQITHIPNPQEPRVLNCFCFLDI